VVTIHLANRVRAALNKDPVEEFNFVFPFTMGALLTFWEEERLARVETAMDIGEGSVLACDLEDAWKSQQVQRCSARLEYKAVWGDK